MSQQNDLLPFLENRKLFIGDSAIFICLYCALSVYQIFEERVHRLRWLEYSESSLIEDHALDEGRADYEPDKTSFRISFLLRRLRCFYLLCKYGSNKLETLEVQIYRSTATNPDSVHTEWRVSPRRSFSTRNSKKGLKLSQ
ncbi:unnamed protein product, partial [Nesidiocoris tenuis]